MASNNLSYPMTKEKVFLVFFLHPEAPIQILLALFCGMPQALFCLINLFLQQDSGIVVVVVVVVDSFDLWSCPNFCFGRERRRSSRYIYIYGNLEENSFVLLKTTFWS